MRGVSLRVSILALGLALCVGCGEVELGEGKKVGAGGSADASGEASGAPTDASAGVGGQPPDAQPLPEAGWFDCAGCECDGTTHYCLRFSGGGMSLLSSPPLDAAVCTPPDGGFLGCLPLPAGCGPSCDCVMQSFVSSPCTVTGGPYCTQAGGDVNVVCGGVCASPDTPIATPSGPRAIAELRPGDRVYSVDHGRVVAVPIRRVQRVDVHLHSVMRVELASGATLEISAPHPTADGRRFGDLAVGEELDGVRILRVERIPYAFDATYDILPDSDTGSYFAGGVLIGSSMAPPPSISMCVAAP